MDGRGPGSSLDPCFHYRAKLIHYSPSILSNEYYMYDAVFQLEEEGWTVDWVMPNLGLGGQSRLEHCDGKQDIQVQSLRLRVLKTGRVGVVLMISSWYIREVILFAAFPGNEDTVMLQEDFTFPFQCFCPVA